MMNANLFQTDFAGADFTGTNFVDASSTKELTKALKQAVKAELSEDIEFVSQDFFDF